MKWNDFYFAVAPLWTVAVLSLPLQRSVEIGTKVPPKLCKLGICDMGNAKQGGFA